jgi:hypothetical protein
MFLASSVFIKKKEEKKKVFSKFCRLVSCVFFRDIEGEIAGRRLPT